MNYSNILYEKRDRILYLTINRPKALNALNAKTLDELEDAIDKAAADHDVRAVILTGAGEKAFVAGADISELVDLDEGAGSAFARRGQRLLLKIERLAKPVIAAVNGFALGGGCELAMACAIRIASTNASFGQPEAKLGLIPGYGGTQRLPRLVGKSNAMHLTLTGEIIPAQRAYEIGLVSKVLSPDGLMQAAEKIATTIASMAPLAIKAAIEAINATYEEPRLEDGLKREAGIFGATCATKDAKEGTGAFLEKRKAEFKGK
ncbi:MAG: enoyl-CoA hydratase/isomerase family protein [Candidatus Coatesbacteria bacterium]|nr:enoyl-CoA hydratase/isomerase family protein [Candidatus Coatesbacteria bacterium]